MKNILIIGNWKLNGSFLTIRNLISELNEKIHSVDKCQVAIAPPLLYLDMIKKIISSKIKICAQNVDVHISGAFTGDISIKMLKEIGAQYVIVGHSERRIYHKETNKHIAKKFALIKSFNLTPILCIGENALEKKQGKTREVCEFQIKSIINNQGIEIFKNSVIAYEPVWSIGTGKAATPTQIQHVHRFIRSYLEKQDKIVAKTVIIQYGGSINIDNTAEIISQPDVDGLLVGKSSLNAEIFSKIVKLAVMNSI
ncbi:triose-phosphate isomerase [Candidatus Pantoea edessiphila]|uniref:Triosephosphate isomerase n=1 Tax=Candidatus Pantoea edessiphila TaxID=2044610 RepID=A0A2P5SZ36_9GAMM|nr:triose-phosphate isomerase [Candidatus Pantoea edessiphila]MBK4775275.1 triose-phosphate isomerase [Pantoea sp. Edef]PPI87586.1 triose-phosphate isomerase [Candidatus Pantoea edessiphila]